MKTETQNNINNDGSFDRQVPYDYVKGKIETRFYKVFFSEKREKIQCSECGKQTDEVFGHFLTRILIQDGGFLLFKSIWKQLGGNWETSTLGFPPLPGRRANPGLSARRSQHYQTK